MVVIGIITMLLVSNKPKTKQLVTTKQLIATEQSGMPLDKLKENYVFSLEEIAKYTIVARDIVKARKEKEEQDRLEKIKAKENEWLKVNLTQAVSNVIASINSEVYNHAKTIADIGKLNFFSSRRNYDAAYHHKYPDLFHMIMNHFHEMGYEIYFNFEYYSNIGNVNFMEGTKFNPSLKMDIDQINKIKAVHISWLHKVLEFEDKPNSNLTSYRN